MVDHVLRLRGEAASEDPVHYGPLLRHLLNALVDGCQQATRLRVEGRSVAKGSAPGWLEPAAAFRVQHLGNSELVLHGSPLGNVLPAHWWPPTALTGGRHEPERSGLDLLEDSLEQAVSGQMDGDRYDRHLLETFESFGRLLDHGVEAIELINGRTVRLDTQGLSAIHECRARMPQDREESVTGRMQATWFEERFFALDIGNGTLVRGIVAPALQRTIEMSTLLGQVVEVRGVARFQPSGAMFRIDADRVELAGTTAKPVDIKVQIQRLVEEGRVREARERVKDEVASGRTSAIGGWAKLLALPTTEVRAASARGDMSRNRAWLHEHEAQYRGTWVALRDGELVASDQSFIALQKRLREDKQEHVFLTKCGGAGDTKTGT